jgi:hypothetical protein
MKRFVCSLAVGLAVLAAGDGDATIRRARVAGAEPILRGADTEEREAATRLV